MNKNMVILDALARKQGAFTLGELHEALNHSISERTLRRILKVLAEEGKINLIGKNKNRQYQFNLLSQSTKPLPPDSNLNSITNIFSNHSLAIYQKLKMLD